MPVTKSVLFLLAGLLVGACASLAQPPQATPTQSAETPATPAGRTETPDAGASPDWVIAVHGGAGVKTREELTPDLDRAYRDTLAAALEAGADVLRAGGEGPLAIEAALIVLEDSPLFNAGHGAALDSTGNASHDASIMRGDTRDAGAIAGSSRIRNPISGALAVMAHTENVLLAGDGADWFAAERGLALADPLYFQTEDRHRRLLEQRALTPGEVASQESRETAFGTVGAVVLDRNGTLSAGTSTGGRTNKRFGRIGDSPIIGAGTYAANGTCAVSATGHGEYFIRWTVARDVCARVELAGETLETAAHTLIVDTLAPVGGSGAVIALSPEGEVVFSMNGAGMYRGAMSSQTPARTAIHIDESIK